MFRSVAAGVVLTFAFAIGVSAQGPAPTPIRDSIDRVRITLKQWDAAKVVGVIDRVDAQALTLIPDGRPLMTVPLTAIAQVERPDGKASRGRRAFFGTLIGMVGGYGVSRLAYDACGQSSFLCELDNLEHRMYGVTIGGAAGGVIGAFAGSTQRWKTVPLSSLAKPD